MDTCVFCDIVKGKTDTKIEKETENLIVFRDINPQAAVHLLIIPKKHIENIADLPDEVWNDMKDVAVFIARDKAAKGFRLVHNAGDAASIAHVQMHFLADIAPERAK
jgi:histidine triad (HIT) family protein